MKTATPEVRTLPLRNADDVELLRLSRTMTLSLNLEEMKTIRTFYGDLERDPTDIELETLAQTWSEHCKHKVFNSAIDLTVGTRTVRYENLFKETIKAATKLVRKKRGRRDFCLSVFEDNAGIIRFNDTHGLAFKVETHNHPSALDPYGGANTGIGGVIRDILGCGLGAKPVFNTDVFCFADPATPWSRIPKGVLHPRRVLKGVVAGVRDYGNRMGIPTINGSVHFHPDYLGNPLVYCGTAGIIPVDKIHKATRPGCDIVAAGGRTGRDGIHGATFSSAELTSESETVSSQAVQIGNPIEEKKVQDIMLQARDLGLYINATDCGAGGFASAIGEIARETGAEVYLDRPPLKYKGLKPWEIFLSESQERMVFIVKPGNTGKFIDLMRSEDVEATVIGRTTSDGLLKLYYGRKKIGELPMAFLHDGVPKRRMSVRAAAVKQSEKPLAGSVRIDHASTMKKLLGLPTSSSKEWIIRQYDHEVGGGTFLKPLQGRSNDGPGDASAHAPLLADRARVVVVSNGINTLYGAKDPYRMALSVIDEAFRQIIAAGGDPDRTAILDNFCWGNPTKPEQVASLALAAQGCYDAATAYLLPFISGKDSFYNEFTVAGKTISIPPTLLISAVSISDSRHLTPSFFQSADTLVYAVGLTRNELGGSQFYLLLRKKDGIVPNADLKRAPAVFRAVHEAIRQDLIDACHDVSENGIACCLAEMAFSGEVGATLDLGCVPASREIRHDYQALYSESNTRFLCEVRPENRDRFEKILGKAKAAFGLVGRTTLEPRLKITGMKGRLLVNEEISEFKKAWQKPV